MSARIDSHEVAGFTANAQVRAWVGGVAWQGDPGTIPLTPGAEIVIEVNSNVTPHSRYLFPPS